jgi:tRNA(Ile)-lysidine synthase
MPPSEWLAENNWYLCCSSCWFSTSFLHIILAVANSGGPDSTCLLFLINRHLKQEQSSTQDHPHRVVSLTVDHGLQSSSSAMAEHCTKVATSLGIEHFTSRIRWSDPPFPKRPSEGDMFESTARLARYHLLFQTMRSTGADVLAFGHHADDQVETSLMRLARGTTEVGAGGMRWCRRWGMGMGKGEGSLGWAGHEGMNRWIVRPLLDVIKVGYTSTLNRHYSHHVARIEFWQRARSTVWNTLPTRRISNPTSPSAMPFARC